MEWDLLRIYETLETYTNEIYLLLFEKLQEIVADKIVANGKIEKHVF